jgi:predicted ATP-binding protein involved in virulence
VRWQIHRSVILIDELDLHLHPRWQRTIIDNLKKTFPLMQFFATTHSPILIGEARPEELVVLTETGSSRVDQSYGLTSNQVLEFIMGAESRDPKVESVVRDLFKALETRDLGKASEFMEAYRKMLGGVRSVELVRAEAILQRYSEPRAGAAE